MKVIRKISRRMAMFPNHFVANGGNAKAAVIACGYRGSAGDLAKDFLKDDRILALVAVLLNHGVPETVTTLARVFTARRSSVTKTRLRHFLNRPDEASLIETPAGFFVVMDAPEND